MITVGKTEPLGCPKSPESPCVLSMKLPWQRFFTIQADGTIKESAPLPCCAGKGLAFCGESLQVCAVNKRLSSLKSLVALAYRTWGEEFPHIPFLPPFKKIHEEFRWVAQIRGKPSSLWNLAASYIWGTSHPVFFYSLGMASFVLPSIESTATERPMLFMENVDDLHKPKYLEFCEALICWAYDHLSPLWIASPLSLRSRRTSSTTSASSVIPSEAKHLNHFTAQLQSKIGNIKNKPVEEFLSPSARGKMIEMLRFARDDA